MVTDRFYVVITWEKLNLGGKTKNRRMPLCSFLVWRAIIFLFHFLCQDKDQSLTIFGATHTICSYFILWLTSRREWIRTSMELSLIIYNLFFLFSNVGLTRKITSFLVFICTRIRFICIYVKLEFCIFTRELWIQTLAEYILVY